MEFLAWPTEQTPRSATFISDLHLFSSRSDVDRHRDLIRRSIEESEMCVWGGDLFDFRWTRLACASTTVQQATEWLNDWLEQYPSIPFIFLRGNHDAHASFARALETLAAQHDHFYAGLDALRVSDALMLHGDLIEGEGTRASLALYRESWERRRIAGAMQNRAYDAIVAARLHTAAASAAHRHKVTCRRLWKSVDSELGDEISGVRRVIFGHTHRQIEGLKCGDIEFYNGGAAIRHVKFAPVRIEFRKD